MSLGVLLHHTEPPTPDEGRVERVELDHQNGIARAHHTSGCQACCEPVRWDYEHVLEVVTLVGRMRFGRPGFLGRVFWAGWAPRT